VPLGRVDPEPDHLTIPVDADVDVQRRSSSRTLSCLSRTGTEPGTSPSADSRPGVFASRGPRRCAKPATARRSARQGAHLEEAGRPSPDRRTRRLPTTSTKHLLGRRQVSRASRRALAGSGSVLGRSTTALAAEISRRLSPQPRADARKGF
jgi:hypothetical protein